MSAISSGRHVLIEKPVALNPEQVEQKRLKCPHIKANATLEERFYNHEKMPHSSKGFAGMAGLGGGGVAQAFIWLMDKISRS